MVKLVLCSIAAIYQAFIYIKSRNILVICILEENRRRWNISLNAAILTHAQGQNEAGQELECRIRAPRWKETEPRQYLLEYSRGCLLMSQYGSDLFKRGNF